MRYGEEEVARLTRVGVQMKAGVKRDRTGVRGMQGRMEGNAQRGVCAIPVFAATRSDEVRRGR